MKKFNTVRLCRAGAIAGLYTTLNYAFAPVAFGAFQIRPAEALCILPLIFPESVWALFVGCILSNLLSPFFLYDVVFGSLATLLASFCTYLIGKKISKKWLKLLLGGFSPVLFNTLIIPYVIVFLCGDLGSSATLFTAYLYSAFSIFITETACVYGLGVPLYLTIEKLKK